MSQTKNLEERVRSLFKDVFLEISDISDQRAVDAAHVILNDELLKKPIEFGNAIVRHASVSGDDIKGVISEYVKHGSQYDRRNFMPDILLEGLSYRAYIEAMPKIDISHKNVSYLEAVNHLDASIVSLEPKRYCYTEPFLATSRWSDSVIYRNREDLVRPFEMEAEDGHTIDGEAVIVEKVNRSFEFPKFKGYVSPSIILRLYDESSPLENRMKIIDSLYNELHKL